MSNLSVNTIKKVMNIAGRKTEYASKVRQAESIVELIDKTPKEFRIELIAFVLYICGYCDNSGTSKKVLENHDVKNKDIILILNSVWMKKFRIRFCKAWGKQNPLQEMAVVVSWSMRAISYYDHHIAMFAYIFTCMNSQIEVNKGKAIAVS